MKFIRVAGITINLGQVAWFEDLEVEGRVAITFSAANDLGEPLTLSLYGNDAETFLAEFEKAIKV